MSDKNSFLKKFQNFVFHEKMLARGGKIVVGFSGGPDSTGLVLLLNELKEKHNLDLHLVHVNYGLRGADSTKDEEFVREFAKRLKLSLDVINYSPVSLRSNAGATKGNLEEKMREFRYEEFEKIRESLKYDLITVGHTKDDLVETFLMNLIRGAGMKGLAGIKTKRGKVIRPLLCFEKKEILDFLESKKQSFRTDKSNLDKKFFRNKVRLELLPFLEKEYSLKVRERIASLAQLIDGASGLIDKSVERKYNEVSKKEGSQVVIDLDELKKESRLIRGEIFRRAIFELKGDTKNVSFQNIFELEKIILSKKGKKQEAVFEKIKVKRNGSKLILEQ